MKELEIVSTPCLEFRFIDTYVSHFFFPCYLLFPIFPVTVWDNTEELKISLREKKRAYRDFGAHLDRPRAPTY